MPKFILGDGPTGNDCDLMIVGERPGGEEYEAGRSFVGPAGRELWDRLRRIVGLRRARCYTTNLVKTFSVKPPSKAEILRDQWRLQAELYKVRPRVILTVGYHAARWFLPQFAEVNGDLFHGLAFDYHYGRFPPGQALLVPACHSAAALRQPDRFQNQFTQDLEALAAVLQGRRHAHVVHPLVPYHVGLASVLAQSGALGFDSEGYPRDPQCLTLSNWHNEVACVETFEQGAKTKALPLVQDAFDQALTIDIHNAKSDVKLAHALGLRLSMRKVRCTMIMAYLLGLPQSLKTLSYRLLGYEMGSYEDLVQPLDDALVRHTLGATHETQSQRVRDWREAVARATAAAKAEAKSRRQGHTQAATAARTRASSQVEGRPSHHRRGDHPGPSRYRCGDGRREVAADQVQRPAGGAAEGPAPAPPFPPRALTSIAGILTKPADQTLRQRWTGSKFYLLQPLPPEPTWKDAPKAERTAYAMGDALAHREVARRLWPRICARGLERAYALDMGVLPWLIRSEEVGMACDGEALQALSKQFQEEYDTTCQQISRLAGHDVNPRGGEQVSTVLFEELGIRPTRLTKSKKHYTTADKYLKARRPEHPIIPLVISARQLSKYKSTYTDKLPGMLVEGRYHHDWRHTTAATGRLAEQIIILIPKHDPTSRDKHGKQIRMDRAKAIRNAFYATFGHRLVAVDLSQIELRVMADVSQDRRLMEAFLRGEDIHAQVAADLLGAPRKKEQQDESAHRLPAKTVNFGIINGMTEYGMLDQLHEAGQLHWTIDDVRDLLDEWFKVHRGVWEYWQRQITSCERLGYVKDMFGRRRYISAIWSQDERIRKEAERQTLMPIQAGADGISKVWGARIWKDVIRPRQRRGIYAEPWVREHDATTLEVARREADDVRREMLALVPDLLSVPTTAEGKIGVRWGELAA